MDFVEVTCELPDVAEKFYVTISSPAKLESEKIAIDNKLPLQSENLNTNNIEITKIGEKYELYFKDLEQGATVKIYSTNTGDGLVGEIQIEQNGTSSFMINNLFALNGSVYFSLTQQGKTESNRLQVDLPN